MSAANNSENTVSQLVQQWADAASAGNLEQVMALYTPDIVAFDALGPLQHKGAQAYREHWEMCMSFVPPGGKMIMEPHEVNVTVEGKIAFVHYVARCGCIDDKGAEQVGWMRATVCCRHTADGWRIAHEHYSSPFDPQTMKIAENLQP